MRAQAGTSSCPVSLFKQPINGHSHPAPPYSLRRRVRRSFGPHRPEKDRGRRAKCPKDPRALTPRATIVPLCRAPSGERTAKRLSAANPRRPARGVYRLASFVPGPPLRGRVRPVLSPPGLPSFPTASPASAGRPPRPPSVRALGGQTRRAGPSGGAPAPPGCVLCEARPGRRFLLRSPDASDDALQRAGSTRNIII